MPIVVPLDGSPEAECALPVAVSIALRSGAALELVRVDPSHTTNRSFLPGRWSDTPADPAWRISYASACLRETARRFMPSGGSAVSTLVLDGPMQEVLGAFLGRFAGLVVVAAHGAPAAGTLGRLADCALRHHDGPVLLVPREDGVRREPDWRCQRLLVADSDPPARKGVLAPVAAIAQTFGSKVTLVRPARSGEDLPEDRSAPGLATARVHPPEPRDPDDIGDWPGDTASPIELRYGRNLRKAAAIASMAAALGADLIVVAAGGGTHRGSSLVELLTLADVPVLSLAAAATAIAGASASPAPRRQRAASG